MEEEVRGQESPRRFCNELKKSILNEHLEGHVPIAFLARKYKVHPVTLYYWKRSLYLMNKTDIPDVDLIAELEKYRLENKQLKKALADMAVGKSILEEAVEILKKRQLLQKSKSQKKSS